MCRVFHDPVTGNILDSSTGLVVASCVDDSVVGLFTAAPVLKDAATQVDEEWHLAHDLVKRLRSLLTVDADDRDKWCDELFHLLNGWQQAARSAIALTTGDDGKDA